MASLMGPDDFMRALADSMDRKRMEAEDWRLTWERFIQNLDDEGLAVFRRILSDLSSDDTGKYASYLEGYVASFMVHNRKICPSCGAHDHTLHDVENLLSPVKVSDDSSPDRASLSDDEYIVMLARYKVHILSDEVHGWGAVECDACGYQYPSLEARVLKKPCSGCGLKPAE